MNYAVLIPKYANDFQLNVLKSLLESSHKITGWAVDDRKPKPALQKIKQNLSRGRGGYVIIMALKYFFKKNKNLTDLTGQMNSSGAPVFYCKSINSAECINKIKSFNADVIIALGGFGIIKSAVLNICPYGVISYHHGDMRKYRGQPPGFWELYYGERVIGITVQKLSDGLDCGEPVEEMSLPIHYKDTLGSLQKRIYENSAGLMLKALDNLDTGPVLTKLNEYGIIYTLPNLSQWLLFNFKIFFRRLSLKPKW
jgi:folate-dependent phosphoribosylglycinamide formyltransferase PurN